MIPLKPDQMVLSGYGNSYIVHRLENHPAAVRSAVNNTVHLPYAAVRGEVDAMGTGYSHLNLSEKNFFFKRKDRDFCLCSWRTSWRDSKSISIWVLFTAWPTIGLQGGLH